MGTPGVLRLAPWLALGALGCSSDEPPAADATAGGDGACKDTRNVEIWRDRLGDGEPPRVVPFGERFAFVVSTSFSLTRAADATFVSWLDVEETLHFELVGLCPDDVCRNVHGSALLATASGAELVLAEQGSSTSMQEYPLRLLAWSSDGGDPTIAPLFDAHVNAITTRTGMKSSRDGARALFALGNIDVSEIEFAVLEPGGKLVAPASAMTLSAAPWDCLEVVPTDEAGALSAVSKAESGTEVVWHVRELDAGANAAFETSVTVPVGDALGYGDCPQVIEGGSGFFAQWVSDDGRAMVVRAARDAEPELLALDVSPGALQGALLDQLLFLSALDDGSQGWSRLSSNGDPSGPPIMLPALPESTSEHHRAPPTVLATDGHLLRIDYELESGRVIEELRCP